MTVYLLHLNQPLDRGHNQAGKPLTATHYIGFCKDLDDRLARHAHGTGARFTQVCVERGIDWIVARTWQGSQFTRTFERHLKNQHNSTRLCPICNPRAMKRAVIKEAA